MAMAPDDYPARTPRRLVLAYKVPDTDRKVMFDPAAFYFGYFRQLTPAQRRQMLRIWQGFWQHHSFEALFAVPFEQTTYTREKNERGYVRKEQHLLHMPIRDLEWAIQHEIRARQSRKWKAAHLWNGRGAEELFGYGILQPSETPHTGTVVTTAYVRSDSSARNPNVPKYRLLSIDNLFGHIPTNASSNSEDFFWSQTKEGTTDIIVMTKDHAAVMHFARHYPSRIREYIPAKGTAFLPFDFTACYSHKETRPRQPKHFPGTHPSRDVLIMDVFMYWLFKDDEGATLFEISKNLMQMPFLIEPAVIQKIKDCTLRTEVLTHGYAALTTVPEDQRVERIRLLRRLYADSHNSLVSNGYTQEGFTLEFPYTDFETVAYNYVGVEGTARLLFNEKYPPLVLYNTPKPHGGRAEDHTKHPVAYLAQPHVSFDEWTKTRSAVVVEMPNVFIPEECMPEYRQAIAEHYEGGVEQFRRNVTACYMYGTEKEKAIGRKMLALVRE